MPPNYQVMNGHPAIPAELGALLANVETATIGHFEHLGFVGGHVRPVFPSRAVGKAVTVAALGRDGWVIYQAIDLLEAGDVLVISRVDRDDIACVGGGVATAVLARGGVAIVVDGPCTDLEEIAASGLPVWCCGVSAKTSSREHQVGGSINVPISCAGAVVLPGYAVLADNSGVFFADVARMRDIAQAAISRQERSLRLRPHLAAGKSIFDFKG
jgi:4-hydroxy-4-methyl-2-oxoglutarate aldolase